MNQEEIVTEKYLQSFYKSGLIYEPEGFKRPPDFSLNTYIGIEVRRLNQNYFEESDATGLEERSIPLLMTLRQVLTSFDKRFDGNSYWVGMTFKRPLQEKRKTVQDMENVLDGFLKGNRQVPCNLQVNDKIEFEIRSSTVVQNRVFRHAITSDDDSGGLAIQMYVDNINYCLKEKENKIAPIKDKYKEWWLILVDTMMSWYLESHEVDHIRKGISDCHGFNKIIVLDYHGNNCLLEITS